MAIDEKCVEAGEAPPLTCCFVHLLKTNLHDMFAALWLIMCVFLCLLSDEEAFESGR